MKRELHFPTPIYYFDIKDQSLNIQLEKDILNWMNQDKGVSRTNVKGWHSHTNMHTKPEFAKLTKALHEAQFKIYKEEHLDSEPFLGNMWANINYPGGFNRPHLHPNALFSGVYWIKAPEKSGSLMLYEPRPGAQCTMPNRKEGKLPPELWREVHYTPRAGTILMFPAWLWHEVQPNKSQDIRISISFNFLQR